MAIFLLRTAQLQLGVEQGVDGLLRLRGSAVFDDAAALGPPGHVPHHIRSDDLKISSRKKNKKK